MSRNDYQLVEDIIFMVRKGNHPRKILEKVWDLLFEEAL